MSLFSNQNLVPFTDRGSSASNNQPSLSPTTPEVSLDSTFSAREVITQEELKAAGRMMRADFPSQPLENNREPIRDGIHFRVPLEESQLQRGQYSLRQMDFRGLSQKQLLNGNIAELEQIYRSNRPHLENAVSAFQSHLGTFGLSGRGQNDLNTILTEKRGTYGESSSIMYIAVSKPQELSVRELTNNLSEAAMFAADYSCLKNETRTKFDPIPGGIIITQSDRTFRSSLTSKGSPQIYKDEPFQLGEDTISIHPDTFDRSVRGAIPYSTYGKFFEALESLAPQYERINDPRSALDSAYVNYFNNDLYPRREIIHRLAADFIVAQALNIFADRNDIR